MISVGSVVFCFFFFSAVFRTIMTYFFTRLMPIYIHENTVQRGDYQEKKIYIGKDLPEGTFYNKQTNEDR